MPKNPSCLQSSKLRFIKTRVPEDTAKVPIPYQSIDLVHNVAQLIIRVRGWQLQLQNQPVDLVDAHSDRQPLLHRMLDEPLCVQHHLGDTRW